MSTRLGRTITRLRIARQWSQGELARRVKCTREYITMLEGGQRAAPSLAMLRRLAKALGVPVAALLT